MISPFPADLNTASIHKDPTKKSREQNSHTMLRRTGWPQNAELLAQAHFPFILFSLGGVSNDTHRQVTDEITILQLRDTQTLR